MNQVTPGLTRKLRTSISSDGFGNTMTLNPSLKKRLGSSFNSDFF